ncbi:glycerophosphodiester phosphodiesterase [Candidatus Bathyarchaeota archaeon]|nr:glycerophosphodiester phosphodiesterase [Candidatus Bathyarchaeota archaeon]
MVIEVIGHRGAAGLEPENTLRSIRRAIEIGVDRVEIDVRVTKDGRLVVIHDETVDRTTNGHGYVRDMTFEEIRKLDAGKGEKVPTLEEALNLTRGKVILQIELKVAEATEPTIELIEENGAEREVVITSFIHSLLKKVRYLNPAIRTGALFFDVQEDIFERTISACAEAIHIYYRNITPKLVENAHKRGLKVVAWNPDEVGDMKRIISLGVDAIGSNRPDILINLLREMGMR